MNFAVGLLLGALSICIAITGHAQTFNAIADTYVDVFTPTTNYGTATVLNTHNVASTQRAAYLKFDTSGVASIVSATLRVSSKKGTGGAAVTLKAFAVSDVAWSETGMVWNDKPALGPLLGSVAVQGNQTYVYRDIDVTSYVVAEKLAGRHVLAFGLHNGTEMQNNILTQSRENSIGKPQLVIVANVAPTVSITSPADSATFAAPASFTLTATAADSDGSIAKVEFFQGTTLVGTVTSAPYSVNVDSLGAGSYTFTAVATDNHSGTTISAPVGVTVNAGPTVALHFIHVDHLNTPRLIADSTGTTVWRHDNTEPFGDSPADEDPSGAGAFEFPLGLSHYYRDKETGNLYAQQRDAYSPGIGRFPQSDPIGLEGGINTYAYVANDPLRLIDPDGLQAQGAAAVCGPYMLACVAVISGAMYCANNVIGIMAKGAGCAANDPCYDDPCERRQKVLLKWYTNLIESLASARYVAWHVKMIQEAHKYNRAAAMHNRVCPKAQVPYIGVSPYLDVIPGGKPPDLSDIYLRGP